MTLPSTSEYQPLQPNGVVVAEFRKNAHERATVTVRPHEGQQYIDFRAHQRDQSNNYRPTRKGITLRADCYPDLARAVRALGQVLGYPEDALP